MPLQSLSILCYILKYVPGMHLRVSDEAETVGLDLDQFFDEQIGNWSLFDHTSGIQDGKMISTPPPEEKQDSKV
jgi:Amt family ammonium transporter